MAPEQIRGMPPGDQADLYSLGCTLFELITGKPPYTGATTQELLNKHLKAPPPALENVNPNVTMEFAQLIRWTLQKDPAARPGSSEEFCQRVRQTPVFRRGWPGGKLTSQDAYGHAPNTVSRLSGTDLRAGGPPREARSATPRTIPRSATRSAGCCAS